MSAVQHLEKKSHKELLERHGIKPHATRRIAHGYMVFGGLIGLAGLAAESFIGVAGTFFVAAGWWMRRRGDAVQVVNRALHQLTLGRLSEAEALLECAQARNRSHIISRVIDIQRASIALRRGDLDATLEHAKAAIERPLSWATRFHDQQQRTHGQALHAFACASRDESGDALQSIEAVRESEFTIPESLARAELAAAMLLERAGERDALRAHIEKNRELLFNHTRPRDRAIVRAFERMLQAKTQSVYRKAAKAETASSGELSLEDWVERLAPGAAPFVRSVEESSDPTETVSHEASDEDKEQARKRVAAMQKQRGGSQGRKVLLLWIVLIILFLAIWTLLSPSESSASTIDIALPNITLILGGVLAFFGAAALLMVARMRRQGRKLVAALLAIARGDDSEGKRALEELAAKGRGSIPVAQAHGTLAKLAFREGDLEGALEHVNTALGKLKNQRAAASDWVYPALLCQRAAYLAALGRVDEARAEVALVAETYTSYPFFAGAQTSVALMEAANTGDVAAAARLARNVADLPLAAREELLLDLARAADKPGSAGAGELERLRATLKRDADARAWVQRIAPAFLPAFENATALPS